MYRLHSALTVAVPVKENKSFDLRALLRTLNLSTEGNQNGAQNSPKALCDFENSITTLIATGVVLPEQNYHGEKLPETLVFATTYYGSLREHLDDLVKHNKPGLCEIFRHCVNFPDYTSWENVNNKQLKYFIRSHNEHGAFSSRYSPFTKEEVRNEKELRKEIEKSITERALNLRTELEAKIENINGINFLATTVDLPNVDAVKTLAYAIKGAVQNLYLVLGVVIDDKPFLTVAIDDEVVKEKGLHAGNIIRELAKEIQGGGGGQPFFATAGGKNAAGLATVLEKAKDFLS
ncbi:MAG: hypothetical protein EOO07_12005 [Chitinophagaceae bacterium]|nr:MAG: hypothetical protein EOO07_12005 [Chitinophagaceae bacterium]